MNPFEVTISAFAEKMPSKLHFEDEFNSQSTRRIGNAGEIANFSLNNKDELNRNFMISKKRNMDFSRINQINSSPVNAGRLNFIRCPKLLSSEISLRFVAIFLDFENLLKLMSLKKKFREGFTN